MVDILLLGSPPKPRMVMQLVQNPHTQNYRLHLLFLTYKAVNLQLSVLLYNTSRTYFAP